MKKTILIAAAMLGCATAQPAQQPKACSKYCTNSKACGDSCIPYENTCHKPEGTACTVRVHD